MKDVADILLEINSTSSKNDKQSILAHNKGNTRLRRVLNQIFNPFFKTNIAKRKLEKKVSAIEVKGLIKTFDDYLEFLSRTTGKDAEIAEIQLFIRSQPSELKWLYEAMAIKSLKFGFSESTINKAFGEEFIPKFDLMLAEKYTEKKKDKKTGKDVIKKNYSRYEGKQVIATPKLDGNRCAVFVHDDGSIELLSRSGKDLEGYTDIIEAFKEFPRGIVYDGEILAINDENMKSSELFQKTQKIVRTKGEKKNVMFHAFDMLPIDEFKNGGCSTSCIKRKKALEMVVERHNQPLIAYVKPLYIGMFDHDKINELSEEAIAMEEEGIMVQLADASYQLKRTFDILKVKIMESADLMVKGTFEGEGKNEGKLGGVIVDYKGFDVRVGGGFSDELRESLWIDPEELIGKIVEVQYFKESVDKHGNLSLRFPIFKTIREDKTEPSYN